MLHRRAGRVKHSGARRGEDSTAAVSTADECPRADLAHGVVRLRSGQHGRAMTDAAGAWKSRLELVASKVIVLGGGVAGMTAAHELAARGFSGVVYELRPIPGGKARSMDAIPGTGGRRALPGEHGFRFFPGFYRHVPDTMSRIPYRGQVQGVFDNLVTSTQVEIARADAQNELVAPAHFPVTPADWEATLKLALAFAGHLGIPAEDQAHFVGLLGDLLSACDARRFGEYENKSWWVFADAERRSAGFQKFLADGLTRSLVAARAREMSARTGGDNTLPPLHDLPSNRRPDAPGEGRPPRERRENARHGGLPRPGGHLPFGGP